MFATCVCKPPCSPGINTRVQLCSGTCSATVLSDLSVTCQDCLKCSKIAECFLAATERLLKAWLNALLFMQIVSGSRDKTIKLWNTLGECKYTIGEPDGHTEWVSCVRFSPVTTNPIIVSAGWDKLVKVSLQHSQLLPFHHQASVPSCCHLLVG